MTNHTKKDEGDSKSAPSNLNMQDLLDVLLEALAERDRRRTQGQAWIYVGHAAGNASAGASGGDGPTSHAAASIRIDVETQPASSVTVTPAAPTAPAGQSAAQAQSSSPASSVVSYSDIVADPSPSAPSTSRALPTRSLPHPGERWYSVTRGLSVGVFNDWNTVQPLVSGVTNACFRRLPDRQTALNVFNAALAVGTFRCSCFLITSNRLEREPVSSACMGRRAKYLTNEERERAKRSQRASYTLSEKGKECRLRQNQRTYRMRKSRTQSPFRMMPKHSIPEEVLIAARIPYDWDPLTSGSESSDLGIWDKPFHVCLPEDYVDPEICDSLFEGPEEDIPQFTAKLEARQRQRLVDSGWARYFEPQESRVIDAMKEELDDRLLAWENLQLRSSYTTEHAQVASDVARKWAAKMIYTLAVELEIREKGHTYYLDAIVTSTLPWLCI
ncbi:hypothetical protein CERSUDRAFT_77358 [Gelatoporia subvermispora B]|uniref:Ribonuclease H1 N-terminal domain-containing protein n=1 Tax=Ceriporiopsis subvermispora (strain B) TaxID=914234 RepID=M2R262_CERS8|nr:hypothetical protein CERSUDRAFT_77358 [Gelatoporia subvermispora B]